MRDIFFFDNMLTPKIITVVYWIAILVAVVSGLRTIFGYGPFFYNLIYGVLTIVGGGVGARILCELLIVVFKMNEALQDIRQK